MSRDVSGTVSVPDTVVWQDVGDEVVLLDLGGGEYHTLNDVGSRMWRALQASHDVVTAVSLLRDVYDIDELTLRDDFAAFVERLVGLGLLVTP